MTVSTLNPADAPVVTGYHMVCLLGCSSATLNRHIAVGLIPRPDAIAKGDGKLWKLSTIRAWRPDLAPDLAVMASRPPAKLFLPTAA